MHAANGGSSTHASEVEALLAELATRRASVEDGSGLNAEVACLASAFGEGARELLDTIAADCATEAGRRTYAEGGYLAQADIDSPLGRSARSTAD